MTFRRFAWVACGVVVATALWLHHVQTSDAIASRLVADIQVPRPNEEIACPSTTGPRPLVVLLVLGQSNAANHGLVRSRSQSGAVWYEGRCYAVADPLPGGTGTGGSIWSRLMSSFDTRPAARNVLLVVLAVDATRISDWSAGALSDRLTRVLAELRRHDLTVSAVLWQQGEADAQAGTGREAYAAAMTRLIRQLRDGGISSPVLLARSTRCHNSGSPAVREALAQVTQYEPDVFLGPNTDELGDGLRFDGCHLNSEGLQRAANAWAEALVQRGIVNRR